MTLRNPGFGLGLRTAHYADFLSQPQALDWLEIISDNFMVPGGRPLAVLDRLRPDYPMAMHGVAMSLASSNGPDDDYLRRLKALADRIQPLWISDHLCWSAYQTTRLHDLNPVPYTDANARQVIAAIGRAQDVLQRRLVIENVSSYVEFSGSVCSEWQFLSHVAQQADCLLLLDVNNVFVSSVNHRFDPLTYLQALPAERIQQIHLAGHSRQTDLIIDTHDHPVCAEVWALYAQACELFGPVATMIERDDHIPPLAELIAELQTAREICQRQVQTPSVRHGSTPVAALVGDGGLAADTTVCHVHSEWVSAILSEPLNELSPILNQLRAGHRFDVYHHAYRDRLAEALADTFAKTMLYMGRDLFHTHACRYALQSPPQVSNLNDYGDGFAQALARAYPDHPELCELATLEWHLHEVFVAPNERPLQRADLSQDTSLNWLQQPRPLRAHARLMSVTRSVTQVWNAIHRDEEVPPVQTLSEATALLIWRKGEQPHFLSLDGIEADLIGHMLNGHSIASACEAVESKLSGSDPDFLQHSLNRWLELELLLAPLAADSEVPATPAVV